MKVKDALARLQELGTEQNRKVYARHGVNGPMHGVSFANLKQLKKEIGKNHRLAESLWRSGNHDARVLATMVADPAKATARGLDEWARDLDNYVITDAFSGYVARSGMAKRKFEVWGKRQGEFIGQAGWNLLTTLANKKDERPDRYFVPHIATIEHEIHQRKNRVRHAMNMALIAIGLRSPALEKKATAAAKRIGKVEVDHGETSCTTPEFEPYVKKAKAYYAKRGRR